MNKKILYPIVTLAVGIGLAVILATSKPAVAPKPYQPQAITVRVVAVAAKAEYLSISSQGTVQPRSQSDLIPEVSGRVVWTSPALVGGGSFDEADVLLRIDDADYKSAVQKGQAALNRAEVELSYAQDELKRLKRLSSQQLASQSQLDSASRVAKVAEANLMEGQAILSQAERDLARTELRAPFKGLVRSEQVDIGQFVSRGNRIGQIYATDFVEVRLPIAASQLAFLDLPISSRGEIPPAARPPVTLTADFGNTRMIWEGTLVRTEAEIDAQSRMIYGVTRLRNESQDDGNAIPVGLFVQADIRGRQIENLVRLPRSAVRDNQQVLVVDLENRLHFREVSILRLEHDEVLISAGLADGELVCISPLQTVVEGMHVQPIVE